MDLLVVQQIDSSLLAISLSEDDLMTPFFLTIQESPNTISDFVGFTAHISWNGIVQETYPAQISATTIERLEKSDSPLFLYLSALQELATTDSALSDSITEAAFNLDGIKNLTVLEKEALTYVGGSYFNVTGYQSTFKQLEQDGKIKDGTFTNGIYIEIQGESLNSSHTKVKFSMSKYRSGDGAYYFSDCVGRYKKDAWTYTIGAHMIS